MFAPNINQQYEKIFITLFSHGCFCGSLGTAIIDPSIRIFGNNGLSSVAGIDLTNNTIIALQGLGFKDYNAAGNGIDASNQDGMVNIQNWPVFGMY